MYKIKFLLAAFTLALTGATAALAQGYPNRVIRIIVPFTTGGGNDVFARIVAQKLQERLGQPVIVENKPGAGGNIGIDAVAKSAPDGYTLLLANNGFTTAPFLTKNLPFDVMKDLSPIGIGVSIPMAIAVANTIPVKTVPELVSYAKANPGKLSYATPGLGTPHHLSSANTLQGRSYDADRPDLGRGTSPKWCVKFDVAPCPVRANSHDRFGYQATQFNS